MPRGSTEAMIAFLMHFADLSDISSVFTEAKGLLSVRPSLKRFSLFVFVSTLGCKVKVTQHLH